MQARIGYYYEAFRQSFLFVPGAMAAAAALTGAALAYLEHHQSDTLLVALPWIAWEPSGAQTILTSLAGATASVAGVVFSIMMVTLSVASSQLGPRLIRTILKRRATKYTLGIFIGSTVYSLVVLTTVRAVESTYFVPHLAVFMAILFTILSFFTMIYFIHEVAQAIQTPNMVKAVVDDLDSAIDRLFPAGDAHTHAHESDFDDALQQLGEGAPLRACFEGYVAAVDLEALVELATKSDATLYIHKRPGQFVVRESTLAEVWPRDRGNDAIQSRVCQAYIAAPRPTPNQDVECAVNELVEVAARALSPGVNDPFTAINCIDYLGAALSRILQRPPAPMIHLDAEKNIRILLKVSNFPGILGAAFDQLRQYAQGNVAVTLRILEALAGLATFAKRDEDRAAIARHAGMLRDSGEHAFRQQSDLIELHARYDACMKNAGHAASGV